MDVQRNIDQLPLAPAGDWAHNSGLYLTGNRTGNLSLCGTTPNPLSHTSQGWDYVKTPFVISIAQRYCTCFLPVSALFLLAFTATEALGQPRALIRVWCGTQLCFSVQSELLPSRHQPSQPPFPEGFVAVGTFNWKTEKDKLEGLLSTKCCFLACTSPSCPSSSVPPHTQDPQPQAHEAGKQASRWSRHRLLPLCKASPSSCLRLRPR